MLVPPSRTCERVFSVHASSNVLLSLKTRCSPDAFFRTKFATAEFRWWHLFVLCIVQLYNWTLLFFSFQYKKSVQSFFCIRFQRIYERKQEIRKLAIPEGALMCVSGWESIVNYPVGTRNSIIPRKWLTSCFNLFADCYFWKNLEMSRICLPKERKGKTIDW